MTRVGKPAGAVLLIMALLSYAIIFQGSRGIWERDEGRYTNIALRMLQTGDLIVPSFNDDVPHYAKPPLTYWAIAGGITLFGRNEWGARLPNALAFAGTVLLVFAMARRITPDRPWLPSVIYATSLAPFIAADFVTTDTLLTLWETLAVLGFVCWWHRKDRTQGAAFLLMMWSGFGLAFLTKGPPGLLPLLAILFFVALVEGWRSALRLFSVTGLVTFAVIGLGWYLVVVATHPGLATYFVRDEVALRFASGMYHRNPEWYKGFMIYVPVLLLGSMPWTLSLFRGARSVPITLFSSTWWRHKLKEDQWTVFLILWFFLPLTVFFVSKSRLPLYILPLFVPIALMTARRIIWPSRRTASVCLLAAWVIILLALKFAGSIFPYAKDSRVMARAIANNVQPLPKEVIFVDSEPFWGLNLYLQCEVEHAVSSSDAKTPSEEPLAKELQEKEKRTLYVVEKSVESKVLEMWHSLGYPAYRLGHSGSWVFIALSEDSSNGRDLRATKSGE